MTEGIGRRELNKTRTREGIIAALKELAGRQPLTEITVDQLAEHAGISRRTFFNYFGSIPAVLSEIFAGYAAQMLAPVDRDLVRSDPVEALRALVRGGAIPADFISWLAALNCHKDATETSVLLERAVWADTGAWLEGVLLDLLPEGTDPLYVSTLASGVMGTFSAAEQRWLTELAERSGTEGAGWPSPPDPEAIHAFSTHLDRALGYLAQGWRPLP